MKANKTIRWKVVDENRNSWITKAVESGPEIENDFFTKLKYEKGKLTKAPQNSKGCFCFKTKTQAQKAIPMCEDNILLKVKTYGKGKTAKGYIAHDYPGTICYPAVMALE